MRFSPALALYRIAWEPALLLVRTLSAIESGVDRISGRPLWPNRWRLAERLDPGPSRNTEVTPSAFVPARALTPKASNTLWMHGASLGESKGVWAVARALAAADDALTFVLTTNTIEARDFLSKQVRADTARFEVRLAPLDHPRVVRRFLRGRDVRALVLFEIELWPHFVREAKRAGKPVLWISALHTRSAFRPVLRGIDWTLAQSDADAAAIRRAGAPAVESGADLRGLHYLRDRNPGHGAPRAGIALVSLHADELGAITPALSNIRGDYPVFVIPRKMESLPAFRAALEPLGFELRSANPRAPRQIVDAFGLVGEILARCRACVMGGSFAPHGGHNLWEPLMAGVFTTIGPSHESQRYLVEKLKRAGLLRVASRAPDLDDLHEGPDFSEECRAFVQTEESLLNVSMEILRKRLAGFAK